MEKLFYGAYGDIREILFPAIPEDILAEYPYCYIKLYTGYYDLIYSKTPWWYNGSGLKTDNLNDIPWYRISISSVETATEWTYYKNNTTSEQLSLERLIWCNHDIERGSVGSGTIYKEAFEPITESALDEEEKHFSIREDTMIELANIARNKSGLTYPLTIEEMKNIFNG